MPRRKDDPPDLVTIKVRISESLKAECQEAREAGPRRSDAESTFIRYLLELGLRRYQTVILPGEISSDADSEMEKRLTIERKKWGITPEQLESMRDTPAKTADPSLDRFVKSKLADSEKMTTPSLA